MPDKTIVPGRRRKGEYLRNCTDYRTRKTMAVPCDVIGVNPKTGLAQIEFYSERESRTIVRFVKETNVRYLD